MTTRFGFELIEERDISELDTKARLFRHISTGAELLSLENSDENKAFSVNFRTAPQDSTGVAHILEHSVLAGSHKYPVKEPFIELVKGSLQTFVNAFTYPDKTCYPCASQNLQDFYNLIDVYVDAVFHPLLKPYILDQEGWHYELEDPSDPVIYKGVVFNEMKGAYSDPDGVQEEAIFKSLFPDNLYRYDSGGDPRAIPDLTYKQFTQFHETYYHPTNTLFFFYGDDPPEERLRLIDSYLQGYDEIVIDSEVPLQPYIDEPRQISIPYAASEDENKSYLTVNWLLPENKDPELVLGLGILGHILLGTPASPLRKALIESGLGEDLTGLGLEGNLRQLVFSTGLKGIDEKNASKVEDLIHKSLATLFEEGIDPDTIAASVNTIEFQLRESNTGNFPRGLFLVLRALRFWLHGHSPIEILAFERPLNAIKARLASGEKYFENLIQKYLIDNQHRTRLLLEPDPDFNQRLEEEEKTKLAEFKEGLTIEEIQDIIRNTHKLKEIQKTPDTPEALATLPTLRLEDIDKENKKIPQEEIVLSDSRILYHDLFTNGILYLDIGFQLHTIPQELIPFIGLFGRALLEIGTETQDFVKLSQRIGRDTGGIRPIVFSSSIRDSQGTTAYLFLRGKSTTQQAEKLISILQDIFLTVKLDNQERFRQMVLEEKAGIEARLVSLGHIMVNNRLKSKYSTSGWITEQASGIEYLFFLRQLTQDIDKDWQAVLEKLEKLHKLLVNRATILANATIDKKNWQDIEPQLGKLLEAIPVNPAKIVFWKPSLGPENEGLTVPTQVNFVGKGANIYGLGY
jgi:Zn-dependent M16 (insulinase) family peptidase